MKIFQLFKLVAVCAVLCAGFVKSQDDCPNIGDEVLEPTTEGTTREDAMKMREITGKNSNSVNFMKNLKDNKCEQPKQPNDDVQEEKTSFSSEKRVFEALVQPRVSTCEPCPPRVHSLRRFYKACYVVFPWMQNVRYVTCNKKCNKVCSCAHSPHSYCQRTSYKKSWFLSYCFSAAPGGFTPGWNFRFLYLPQDCTCHQHWYKG